MKPRFLLPALLLALQAVPGLAQAQSGSRTALRGDVDRDGAVTAADAFSILSAAIGKTPPPEYRLLPNGDADANGRISISDVLLVLGYSVGRDSRGAPVGQPLVAVSLSADSSSIEVGRSTTLRATLTGATDTAVIWRSSAPDIAAVDAQGKVLGRAPGAATIYAISSADTLSQAWTAIAVSPTQIVSLTVAPTSNVVATVGQTVQLSATAVDDQGHTVSQPLTWTSSDPTLATVDGTGKVTALRPGTATIRASGGGKSAAKSVQVREVAVASLSVTPDSVSLEPGQRVTLSATPSDSAGNTLSGRTVGWSSSNPAVASVSALTSMSSSSSVSAVAPGTAVITASSGGKSTSVTVKVQAAAPAAVARLTVTPTTTLLSSLGATAQLSAKLYDASGALLTGRAVSWTSSDTSVAVVDAAGKVTARSNGTAKVTASAEGKSASDSVVVSQAIASLALSPVSASVAVGETAQITAIARDAGGSVVAGTDFTWKSSNTSVATVSAAGVVKGVAAGSATVTATHGAKSASLTVRVMAVTVAVASVSLDPASLALVQGQKATVVATLKDASTNVLTGRTITWTTSSSSVATVTAAGEVSAVAPGTARITATSEGKSASAAVTVTAPAATAPTDSVAPPVPTDSVAPAAPTDSVAPTAPTDSVAPTAPTDTAASAAPTDSVAPEAPTASGDSTVTEAPTGSVEPVPATVTVTPAVDSLTALGQTVQLVATVKDGMGNVLTGQTITWSSSNPDMASVDASGLVTALANGSVSITAAAGSVSGTAQLVVSQKATSISISPTAVHFTALGDSISLAAVAKDATGHTLSNCSTTWLSKDPTVAIVKNTGWVVAQAVGAAMVLASCGTMTDSVGVDVRQEISSVVVTPSNPSVSVGDTAHLAATAKDALGNPVAGAAFTWTSSNTTIATVDSDGDVYAKSAGSATITASADGKSASAPVVVEATTAEAPPSTISGPALAFSDGFDTGAKSEAQDGYGWGGGPSVSSDIAHSGKYSLKFDYPGNPDLCKDATKEQRFTLGQDLTEVWFEYYIYFPNGSEGIGPRFVQRTPVCPEKNDPKGTIANNKFFALWDVQYEPKYTKVLFEYRPSKIFPSGDSRLYGMWCTDTKNCGPYNWLNGSWDGAITDATRGRWVQIRIHVRAADSKEAANGVLQLWTDGVLRINMQNLDLAPNPGGNRFFRNGYLMGWANSGFTEATNVYIDDFKIFRSNPGW